MLDSIELYYFSPTGGTREAAKLFCEKLSENVKEINLTENFTDTSLQYPTNELMVVAAPVFGGRIPGIVTERLKSLHGSGKKAVTLAVYGNRAYEDALLELNNVMKECGFTVIASAVLVARHSIVRSVAAGRPDEQDGAEIRAFAEKVLSKMQKSANTATEAAEPQVTEPQVTEPQVTESQATELQATESQVWEVTVPGNYPYKDGMKVSATPICNDGCNQCGGCAAICPTGAIQLTDDVIEGNCLVKTDLEKCILCMACVAQCPKQARNLPAPMQEAMNQKLGALKAVRNKNEFFV